MATVGELGQERFVSVTTYRKSGAEVATAVWVVPDGADLLVWTPAESGKVKRLRNDARVELAPCSRRGVVDPDAPRVAGVARIEAGAASLAAVTGALKGKYGAEYRVITTIEKAVGTVRRRHPERVVLRITPAA